MNNNLSNKVVYIKDEAMLEEAREMLEKYNQPITNDGTFSLSPDSQQRYLQRYLIGKSFWLGEKHYTETEITLIELEQLLKQNRDAR